MKALLFLNPRQVPRPSSKKGRKQSRKKTTMARKHRKARKAAPRRRRLRVSVKRSRRSVRITLRARRGRGAGKLRLRRIRRSRSKTVIIARANPRRRRSARRNPYVGARRRSTRRSARQNPFSMGGITSQIKGIFSKDNLTVAAGAIAGTVLTQQLVARFGANLPLINSSNPTTKKVGVLTLDVGLPFLGAYLVRKQSPNLAKGMIIAGLVNAMNDALKLFSPGTYSQLYSPVASTGAYLNYRNVPNVLPVGDISDSRAPGYSGMNALANVRGAAGALDNSRAFPSDAWN